MRIESKIYARGAGYEYIEWIGDMAVKYFLVGKVYIEEDGSMKVVAEGEEDDLIKFAHKLKHGHHLHHIDDYYIDWYEARDDFTEFMVIE